MLSSLDSTPATACCRKPHLEDCFEGVAIVGFLVRVLRKEGVASIEIAPDYTSQHSGINGELDCNLKLAQIILQLPQLILSRIVALFSWRMRRSELYRVEIACLRERPHFEKCTNLGDPCQL